MCNFIEKFSAPTDYWIYDIDGFSRNQVIENLQNILRFGIVEPDFVLTDVARSLQKLEKMSEEEFQKNMDTYPFQRRFKKQLNEYSEQIQIAREFFLKDLNKLNLENDYEEGKCFRCHLN